MAPRGRPKKVGLKRMDAAIDALRPMGYSPDFVKRKVKELLDVYGDEGWMFIEEASYSLLIEYILENDNGGQSEKGEPSSKHSQNEDADEGTPEFEPSKAGPSCEANEPFSCSPDSLVLSPITVLPSLPNGETTTPIKKDAVVEHKGLEDAFARPPGFGDVRLAQIHPTRVRKPCLGWIGPKDDEDYVLLKKAPVTGWMMMGERRRKRKSRWDVGPDDIV